MKHFLAVSAALACMAALAQPAPRGVDLRRALEQYHPASAARTRLQAQQHPQPQGRHLSADERVQLRRQLAEFELLSLPKTSSPGPKTR